MASKEVEKTTVDKIFPWRDLLRKRGHIMSSVLLFLK